MGQESVGNVSASSPETFELVIDGLEVGTYPVFILFAVSTLSSGMHAFLTTTLVSIFFGWLGFLIAYIAAQSHAAKYGSLVGLGVTMVLQSPLASDPSESAEFFRQNPEVTQFLGFLLAFGGYVAIVTSFYVYRAKREAARDRIASRFF